MFRKLIKNKKAQNTAEYALLISLVVAAIIAMQTYAQRALQARVRDASQFMAATTNQLGNSVQYEPYYLTSSYAVTTDKTDTQILGANQVSKEDRDTRSRGIGGFQQSSYDTSINGIVNGL